MSKIIKSLSQIQDDIRTGSIGGSSPNAPYATACIHLNANFSCANASDTIINWTDALVDTDGGIWSGSFPSRIYYPSAPLGGTTYMHIELNVRMAENTTGTQRRLKLWRGGSGPFATYQQANAPQIDVNYANHTNIWGGYYSFIPSGSYYQFSMYQDSGGALNMLDGSWIKVKFYEL